MRITTNHNCTLSLNPSTWKTKGNPVLPPAYAGRTATLIPFTSFVNILLFLMTCWMDEFRERLKPYGGLGQPHKRKRETTSGTVRLGLVQDGGRLHCWPKLKHQSPTYPRFPNYAFHSSNSKLVSFRLSINQSPRSDWKTLFISIGSISWCHICSVINDWIITFGLFTVRLTIVSPLSSIYCLQALNTRLWHILVGMFLSWWIAKSLRLRGGKENAL